MYQVLDKEFNTNVLRKSVNFKKIQKNTSIKKENTKGPDEQFNRKIEIFKK